MLRFSRRETIALAAGSAVLVKPALAAIVPSLDAVVPSLDAIVPDLDVAVPDSDVVVPDSDVVVPSSDAGAPPLPIIAPFVQENADVRDRRFGQGLSADYRAILPLGEQNKRVWLDTKAAADGTGKTAASPFKTEAKAYAALVGGDHLMIAGGSILTTPLGELKTLSGRNSGTPTVIQSYDRAAPTNEARYGLLTHNVIYRSATPFVRATSSAAASFIAIRGMFFDHSNVPDMLYVFTSGVNWLLIEQCVFLGAQLALNSANGTTVHVLRQVGFQGQWSVSGKAQGIFTASNFDTIIEDCTFHHCGWKMGAARGDAPTVGGATMFSHGLYAAVQSGGILRRCVFVDPAANGAQLRGNWHSHDNVFISCPLALLHGGGTTYALDAPSGVMALAYRNVITVGEDINPTLPRGYGITVANTRAGSVVEQNLIVGPRKKVSDAITAIAQSGAGYEPNLTRITIRRNTIAWTQGGFVGDGASRVFVAESANIVPSDKVTFADPTFDGLTMASLCGFATISAFGSVMANNPVPAWAMGLINNARFAYAPLGLTAQAGALFEGAMLPNGSWNIG
jgi:hypothetical protein